MNEEYLELRKELIRKTFKDKRKIKCLTPEDVRMLDDDVYPGGEIFTTEDGEFIDLEFQINDFDEVELAKGPLLLIYAGIFLVVFSVRQFIEYFRQQKTLTFTSRSCPSSQRQISQSSCTAHRRIRAG